jgi:hypothetical protein
MILKPGLELACCGWMQIWMENGESAGLEQMREFVKGSAPMSFVSQSRAEKYGWVERVLVGQEYRSQCKGARGVIRGYLIKVTGLSIAQVAG